MSGLSISETPILKGTFSIVPLFPSLALGTGPEFIPLTLCCTCSVSVVELTAVTRLKVSTSFLHVSV